MLEPLLGQGVLHAGVGGANHVGGVAVAAHELFARGGVVDRNQIPVAIAPVAEVTLTFLHRGNAQDRKLVSSSNRIALVVEEEIGFVFLRP